MLLMFVMQGIFVDYKQPFAVTYLGASLMVVYLPIAFFKDWLCNSLKKRKSSILPDNIKISAGLDSPRKLSGMQKIFEMGSLLPLTKKDSTINLSSHEETPFISEIRDEANVVMLKENKELTTREIAIYSFYLAPIWFITEVCFVPQ